MPSEPPTGFTQRRRGAGGHRHYGSGTVKRLNFILRARKLGFGLDTVRGLLALADGKGRSCSEVEDIAARHLADVRAKLEDLAAMEAVLAGMVVLCQGGSLPECPIIETLFDDGT